jgi:hypothetical protein
MLTLEEINLLKRCRDWNGRIGWEPSLTSKQIVKLDELEKDGYLDTHWNLTFAAQMAITIFDNADQSRNFIVGAL